jgi:hypothetical protein
MIDAQKFRSPGRRLPGRDPRPEPNLKNAIGRGDREQ